MKTTITKPLLLSLIKYDLINTKLVLGLNRMGLNADDYLTNLSTHIFALMGHGQTQTAETLYEGYRRLTERVLYVDTANLHDSLNELAGEIYMYLHKYPKPQKKK